MPVITPVAFCSPVKMKPGIADTISKIQTIQGATDGISPNFTRKGYTVIMGEYGTMAPTTLGQQIYHQFRNGLFNRKTGPKAYPDTIRAINKNII